MAAPERDLTSSEEVLPLLVEGMQQSGAADNSAAAAIAEWVQVGVDREELQDAIKVQVHHRRGLSVAFYVPAKKTLLRGWQFGEMFVQPAERIIADWPCQTNA